MLLDIDEFTIDAFINVLFVEITAKQQNNAVADKLHRKYNRYLQKPAFSIFREISKKVIFSTSQTAQRFPYIFSEIIGSVLFLYFFCQIPIL